MSKFSAVSVLVFKCFLQLFSGLYGISGPFTTVLLVLSFLKVVPPRVDMVHGFLESPGDVNWCFCMPCEDDQTTFTFGS